MLNSEEKIIPTIYWDDKYKEGFNEYKCIGLEEKLKDKSYVYSKLETFKLYDGWKNLPKNDNKAFLMKEKAKQVINKHKEWLNNENIFKIKCEFLNIEYIKHEPFPEYYESESGKKMFFFKNYYWCVNSTLYDSSKEKSYEYKWRQWLIKDNIRIHNLKLIIEKSEKNYLKNQLKEKWDSFPQEIKEIIKKNYEDKTKPKIKEYKSSSSSNDECIYACNGMVMYRNNNESQMDWFDRMAEFRENMRDW